MYRPSPAVLIFLLFCMPIGACSQSSKTPADEDTESSTETPPDEDTESSTETPPDEDTRSGTEEESDTGTDSADDADSDTWGDTGSSHTPIALAPVKVLMIMDQSVFWQCVDPAETREAAIDRAGRELDQRDEVQFAAVGFASWSKYTTFTGDWQPTKDLLFNEDDRNGSASDFQGALATALLLLEQDMLTTDDAERADTRYIVLFITDGIPTPKCTSGCDDGDTSPDSLYGVCNTTESIPEDFYVDMFTQCPDYNQDYQIIQKIDDMVRVGEFYGIGDLSFHTIFMFSPTEIVSAVCGDTTADDIETTRPEAKSLLMSMASEAHGTFRGFDLSDEIDFLDFDFEPLGEPASDSR